MLRVAKAGRRMRRVCTGAQVHHDKPVWLSWNGDRVRPWRMDEASDDEDDGEDAKTNETKTDEGRAL